MSEVDQCGNCPHFVERDPTGIAGVPQSAHGQCYLKQLFKQPEAWLPWRAKTDWCDQHRRRGKEDART